MTIGFSEAKPGLLSAFIDPHANIAVRSIDNYGDATNNAGANITGLGYWLLGRQSDGDRNMLLYRISLAALPRRIEIADARFVFPLNGRTNPGGYSYPGWTVNLHEIEGDLAAGTDADERSTGIPWYGGGYGPKPGYDYVEEPAGSLTLTTDEWTALNNAAPPTDYRVPFEIACTAAVQRANDARSAGGTGYFEFLLAPTWNYSGTGDLLLFLAHPTTSELLNPYLWVRYWPALGILGTADTEDRPPDFTKLHNPDLAGTQYRSYLDVVEEGTAGTARKYWGWNFRRLGPRTNVVVGTGRSEATTVRPGSANVSAVTLRSVRVYDHDTAPSPDEGTPSGDYVVRAVDSTRISLDYTDSSGVTTTLLENGTGDDEVTLVADRTFLYAGVKAITIPTIKWSATTGLNVADRWRFSVRGDRRTTEDVDTLGLVRICPPTTLPFGDTANTSVGRLLAHAYTQQLRAASLNRTISAVSAGHLKVRDTTDTSWPVGDDAYIDVFNADGSYVVRGARIAEVFLSDDALYPDELRIDRDWTAPELAALDAAASVTAGVYLGPFARFQVRRLAETAVAGQPQIVLEEAFDDAPDRMQLVGLDGTSETVERLSGTSTLTLTDDLVNTYADQSLVFLDVDPGVSPSSMAGRPYYVFGDVPADQDEGLYRGFYDLFEHRVTTS